jgi:hypothetical protein
MQVSSLGSDYKKDKKYRIIHKSLKDFRPLRYSSRDGHAKGKHVNRGRDTPSFCPNLQVLDMSTLGDAADVNPVIKFLPHTWRGACQQRERQSKFLSYITGARYVHPWWRGRCQSCNQVPATHVKCTVWQELDYRIDICRVTKGGHIENL